MTSESRGPDRRPTVVNAGGRLADCRLSRHPRRRIPMAALFAQHFPGASKSLTSMCDRLVLDSSERTTGRAHCLTPT
jgi:hypothetical protein